MGGSLLQAILALGLAGHVVSNAVDHPVPRLQVRQAAGGQTSCSPWLSIYDSCTAASPGFSTMPISVEASCLCYNSATWQPTVYDQAWATCLEYVATASPALYTSLGGSAITTNVCQAAGDVVNTGGGAARTTATASATGAAATEAGSLADCTIFESLESSCAMATPSFTALGFTHEASCLCYNDGSYDPSRFDNAIGGCLAYYSTASPAFYTSLGGDGLKRTPCASVGDIATGAAFPTAAATTSTAAPTINPITLTTASTASSTSKAAAMAITQAPMWPAAAGLGLLMLV